MRTLAGLCLSCALVACTFAPPPLTGDPGPSPSRDAAVPDAAPGAAIDAAPDNAPDAEPGVGPDAGPPAALCDPEDPALVGCFAFEDTTDDASGSELIVSPINVGFDEGRRGRAAVFTDVSVLHLLENPDLDVDAVTVEMWVRPDALPPMTDDRVALFDNDGQYSVFLFGPATVRCLASGEVEAIGVVGVGTWTHVACVHDGLNVTLYVNGSSRATIVAGPLGRMPNGSNIGGNSPSGGEHFIGRIDELRIWNRARTEDELCEAAGCPSAPAAAPLRPR